MFRTWNFHSVIGMVLALSYVFSSSVNAQNRQPEDFLYNLFLSSPDELKSVENYVSSSQTLELDITVLQSIVDKAPKRLDMGIPNGSGYLSLSLERVDVLSEDFILRTSDGATFHKNDFYNSHYRGHIKGDSSSVVAISFNESSVQGLFTNTQGNYVLAPHGKKGQHILYNEAALKKSQDFNCYSNDLKNNISKFNYSMTKGSTSNLPPVNIFIECERKLYVDLNSDIDQVQAFVSNLILETASIYLIDEVEILLSEVFVWTTVDPYSEIYSMYDLLDKFGETREGQFQGDIAHLITSRFVGGGLAWLDELCRSHRTFEADWDNDGVEETHYKGPYAVSSGLSTQYSPFPTYSWNLNVFGHEMGHTLGSPHTHACVWGPSGDQAIDNCYQTEGGCNEGPAPTNGGTMMSYCHISSEGKNLSLGFGAEPGGLIRSKIENAACLAHEEDPNALGHSCIMAIPLDENGPYDADGPNTGSSATMADAQHADWYIFTPPTVGIVSVFACEGGVDTRLMLHRGSCDNLIMMESNDDDCSDGHGNFYASGLYDIDVYPAIQYYIEWDDKWSSDGFVFEFLFTPIEPDTVTVDCVDNLSLPDSLSNGQYHGSGAVEFGGNINLNASVTITSDTTVTMMSDFSIGVSSNLIIDIARCN